MIISPKYVAWAQDAESGEGTFDANVDLGRWSDDQLNADRDRRIEELSELTRRPADQPLIDGLARDVELITNELVRRARARHPSSQR
ncbi:MAG TPA: hypothetical protein VHW93_00480 [Acidimicrobiales bacterium]|nr:hypothetical protein [Acidimicrobiales bacterium]